MCGNDIFLVYVVISSNTAMIAMIDSGVWGAMYFFGL